MLASTYMATNKFDKATPLLASLAKTAKGAERANAYYAWGLAASNAQEYKNAITAWQTFLTLAAGTKPVDPRIAQVKSSIKALQQAAKNPPAATPATTGNDSSGDSSGDSSSDDSKDPNPGDSGSKDN